MITNKANMAEDEEISPEQRQYILIFELKNLGTEKFKNEDYDLAVEYWLASVKESLKMSVRSPSAVVYENQWKCRLNIAMAYMKLRNWTEAESQLQFVLEQKPCHIKALLRLATVYENLEDYQAWAEILTKIESFCNEKQSDGSQSTSPEVDWCAFDADEVYRVLSDSRSRLKKEKWKASQNRKNLFKFIGQHLGNIGVSENRNVIPIQTLKKKKLVFSSLKGMHLGALIHWDFLHPSFAKKDGEDGNSSAEISERVICKAGDDKWLDAINYDLADLKDYDHADLGADNPEHFLWSFSQEATMMGKSEHAMELSLPLSILFVFQQLLLSGIVPSCRLNEPIESTRFLNYLMDDAFNYSEKQFLNDKNDYPVGHIRLLLLNAQATRKKLVLHVIHACDEVELKYTWTALLRRLPLINELVILFIGSFKQNQHDAPRKGLLMPSVVKKLNLLPHQKLRCFFFQGSYEECIREERYILSDSSKHSLNPDFIIVPEPLLSIEDESDISLLYTVLQSKIPVILTTHACKIHVNHKKYLETLMSGLNAEPLLKFSDNYYSFRNNNKSSLMKYHTTDSNDELFCVHHSAIACYIGPFKEEIFQEPNSIPSKTLTQMKSWLEESLKESSS